MAKTIKEVFSNKQTRKQFPGTKVKFRNGKKGVSVKSIKHPKFHEGLHYDLR